MAVGLDPVRALQVHTPEGKGREQRFEEPAISVEVGEGGRTASQAEG
jgi:hypothetical protein